MRRLVIWPVVVASLLCAAPVSASTLALDAPDGSVVVAHSGYAADAHVIARFGGTGDLDETFGIEGYRRTVGGAVIRQPDARLITYSEFENCCNEEWTTGLWRHLPDGTLDESFGIRGRLGLDLGSANAAALAPDGSIIVAFDNGSCIQVRRVGADGTVDPGFAAEPICVAAIRTTST